ncbi:DUF167 family protein [Ollibium composti]|uniref:UPF0235 protein E6C48_10905 n=1 Tax=Ollibium composti TaxID=2675109 RepID=A0ABY2Q7K6_9HYPH|nr:DUF167 family protein [Mesorhizobium composti]THF57508.1 DUF167 domain-containing protein [Mesorhizobium composti]
MSGPVRPRDDGIDVFVRLTPKSSTDALEGAAEAADGSTHLKVRVRAVPEKGAANAALEKLLAKALGVPLSTVKVVTGGTSRLKTVRITGDAATLAHAVGRLTLG